MAPNFGVAGVYNLFKATVSKMMQSAPGISKNVHGRIALRDTFMMAEDF